MVILLNAILSVKCSKVEKIVMIDDALSFSPEFKNGLLPAIVQDYATGEVLMLAWMNEESWQCTLKSGQAHYYSRSRKKIWHKGEESGNVQKVKTIRLDCDNDAILLIVEQIGRASCHTGHRSCFFRELKDGKVKKCAPRIFDPSKVYG